MHFADGSELQVDFIVFSTGIRPRDKLATQCGLAVAQRGGIMVNDSCQTSDPDIYAIGECASWNNRVYGLVAPGYKMAQVAVDHLLGSENSFTGADLSAKLKLLGVDVGGIGDAHGRTPGARSYVYLDESKEVYKRLIVSADNKTPARRGTGRRHQRLRQPAAAGAQRHRAAGKPGFADPPGPRRQRQAVDRRG